MSKRKRQKRRKSSFKLRSLWSRQPSADLQEALDRADRLILRGQGQEAVEFLEPLLDSYPRAAELHYYLGYARVKAGDIWGGLTGYEQAIKLSRNPSYWLPLASLYLEVGLNVQALHAFRQALKHDPNHPFSNQARETVASLEQDLQVTAGNLGLPVAQVEKGIYHLDIGQQTLHTGDYAGCIAANRQAIKLLPDWPPPYNNLSLALFFDGQPEQAIAAARQVLAKNPQNIQALSNAIRFLTWTGQKAEAQILWERLQNLTPEDDSGRVKMSEAAAIMEDDERVYQLLKPLDKLQGPPSIVRHVQLFLGVAEANTGRRGALRRFKALQTATPWLDRFLAALKAKKPGPGWADRFPYYHSTDLMTGRGMEEFVNLMGREEKLPPQKFQKEMVRFTARFPQIIRVAEKMIWEEDQPGVGVSMLVMIATPEAYAALRRFGLSQAGDDEERMQALFNLLHAGEIGEDETIRMWSGGEWREVQLRQYEISDEPEIEYTPAVVGLLDRALQAFKRGDDKQAERLFRQVLEMEPRAKEAYNNLATLYSHRGERERAKEMFEAALEIDPNYVFPRCNLAIYLLSDDDVESAKAMLAPLSQVKHFHPQEMAFYSYLQARVFTHEEQYDEARKVLEMALKISPDYEPAKELLDHLSTLTLWQKGFKSFQERQQKRDRAKRARLQTRLDSAAPDLAKALSLYSKDVLTGIAREVIPWGGWSGLRKAELLQQIVATLQDQDLLERVVGTLQAEERTALGQVLAEGGSMAWSTFDARYGNDLEESQYWQWHQPKTTMGRLRHRGLLAEATVKGELLVVVPSELRQVLAEMLVD